VGPPIYIDDVETWPAEFRTMADANKQLLINYHTEDLELFRRRHVEGDLNADRPGANRYKGHYSRLVNALDSMLTGHEFAVYHGTRLTPRDVASIKASGIECLTEDLVYRRIDGAFEDKYIDAPNYLALKSDAALNRRIKSQKGRWCGVATTLTLRESGMSYFFRTWGGEALFKFCSDQRIAKRLRDVGVPYVIVCSVPVAELPCGKPHAEHLLSRMIFEDLPDIEPPGFTVIVERALAPNDVLDMVGYHDARFQQWTQWHKWQADERPRVVAPKV
jgi:hypothetical protein